MSKELDMSFKEFFALHPHTSTRLTNVILRAAHDTHTPFPTVLEYWQNKDSPHDRMWLIDGFGPKSMAELDRYIAHYLQSGARPNQD